MWPQIFLICLLSLTLVGTLIPKREKLWWWSVVLQSLAIGMNIYIAWYTQSHKIPKPKIGDKIERCDSDSRNIVIKHYGATPYKVVEHSCQHKKTFVYDGKNYHEVIQ